MINMTFRIRQSFLYLFYTIIFISYALAQFISIKTVPVATGDQFLIFPSQNISMGNVSIAFEDSLLDPFINPAKGTYIKGYQVFSSPVFYSFENNDGNVSTLPLGIMKQTPNGFSGFMLAMQELEVMNPRNIRFGFTQSLSNSRPLNNSANNIYAFGLFGRTIPQMNLSIGGSVFLANLAAMDGVDLLYLNSQDIEQSGYITDYRVGIFGELLGERSYEILLLLNEFDMTHKVTYLDWVWDPEIGSSMVPRIEKNLDHTQTWGIHTRYVQPLGKDGFRIGGILTFNRKSHPKIPNYEIMNIPRDPGNTMAYNAGVGISKTENLASVGIDLVYEPIWSNTWANTDTAVATGKGTIIPAGGKTIENDFKFANWLVRIGIKQENKDFGLQLGLQMRSYRYWLNQKNNIDVTRRKQTEHWVEWIPSWGITVKLSGFELRYMGRSTSGTGRPGVGWQNWGWWSIDEGLYTTTGDILIAPSGDLFLEETRMTTHQIMVSVPLNR